MKRNTWLFPNCPCSAGQKAKEPETFLCSSENETYIFIIAAVFLTSEKKKLHNDQAKLYGHSRAVFPTSSDQCEGRVLIQAVED